MADSSQTEGSADRRLLDPSELGTKEYWDSAYTRELHNHEEDADDEGTIWFSESNAEDAILDQLNRLEEEGLLVRDASPESNKSNAKSAASRFLDLGTGNGHLLFTLREEEDDGNSWRGELVGIDYSSTSIELARRVAEQKQLPDITFERWDLLEDEAGDWLQTGFDVVLDKGTFDAISLMPHAGGARHPCDIYREKVTPLIKPGGFLFITSCNWTKQELLSWLAPEGGELGYYVEAKYPTFTFGGKTGQTIVTLVLRREQWKTN
ncbi:Protein-lysine N-methyltransferase efm4 [Recurvomyces mirabilis]|nr:Protein-lysine N-methyltransferase efm4 [Recurvomyces mirabilis]